MKVGAGNSPPTRQKSLQLNRPLSSNGLPSNLGGLININGNGSVTPVDYYCEALKGEVLLCARFIVHIVAATDVGPGEYGDLPSLTNGIQLFYLRNGIKFNISDGLPLHTHEDWGRWAFDAKPIPYGPSGRTPYFQGRWTMTKYGTPWGLMLFEGDQVGVRLNDDLTALQEQTVIAEGVHLGAPSPQWTDILV